MTRIRNQLIFQRSGQGFSIYLVLPAVVGVQTVGNLPFDLWRQSKEGFREGELIFNLLNSDTMVDKSKEASSFGSFN